MSANAAAAQAACDSCNTATAYHAIDPVFLLSYMLLLYCYDGHSPTKPKRRVSNRHTAYHSCYSVFLYYRCYCFIVNVNLQELDLRVLLTELLIDGRNGFACRGGIEARGCQGSSSPIAAAVHAACNDCQQQQSVAVWCYYCSCSETYPG